MDGFRFIFLLRDSENDLLFQDGAKLAWVDDFLYFHNLFA